MEQVFIAQVNHIWTWIRDMDSVEGPTYHPVSQNRRRRPANGQPRQLRCTMQRDVDSVGWPTTSSSRTEKVSMSGVVFAEPPLHTVSNKRHLDAASLLLFHGADVNMTIEARELPLLSL